MANVATDISARIESLLNSLLPAWEDLPCAAREITSWDWIEQADYVEEWTPKLELLDELRGYAKSSHLAPDQCRRFDRLESLVRQNVQLLDELRRS